MKIAHTGQALLTAALIVTGPVSSVAAIQSLNQAVQPALPPSDGISQAPVLSADGHYVAFRSNASNLVEGDTNGITDIFVRDLQTGRIERIHLGLIADLKLKQVYVSNPQISADGQFVVFFASAYRIGDGGSFALEEAVYGYDRATGGLSRIPGSENSSDFALSADGRSVAFQRRPAESTAQTSFISVYNRDSQSAERLPFESPQLFGSLPGYLALSPDGRRIAFKGYPADRRSGEVELLVYDRDQGILHRIDSPGARSNGAIIFEESPVFVRGGNTLAFFRSSPDAYPQVILHDLGLGIRERIEIGSLLDEITLGPGAAIYAISDDANLILFSTGRALASEDTNQSADVYLYDRSKREYRRVSVDETGTQANGKSNGPAISADGTTIAFVSSATNLSGRTATSFCSLFPPPVLAAGTNVFTRGLATGKTEQASLAESANLLQEADDASGAPSMSADGRFVAFNSGASNLTAGSEAAKDAIFVRDRVLGTTKPLPIAGANPRLSGNGRFLTAVAGGQITLFDLNQSTTVVQLAGSAADLSQDGRFVAIEEKDETKSRILLYDRDSGSSTGMPGIDRRRSVVTSDRAPAVSADGRYVVFERTKRLDTGTSANWLPGWPRILVYDRVADKIRTVPLGRLGGKADRSESIPFSPVISGDGRFVAFLGVSGYREGGIFVYDQIRRRFDWRLYRRSVRADFNVLGVTGLSADGRYLTAEFARFLFFPGRTGWPSQVARFDRQTGQIEVISRTVTGADGNASSGAAAISADGRSIAFVSCATDLESPGRSIHLPNMYVFEQ